MTPKIPQRILRCTTHHACPCQAYQVEQMKSALKVIKTWASFQVEYMDARASDVTVLRDIAEKAAEALGCLEKKP